jgi:hypothetical protein
MLSSGGFGRVANGFDCCFEPGEYVATFHGR